jgi:glycine dehydrogenase
MALDSFLSRHNGPRAKDIDNMLTKVGTATLDELIDKTVPPTIRLQKDLDMPDGISEYEYLKRIWEIVSKNKVYKTYIGLGYYDTIFPSVIQRNILENPAWYTSYTPYQAEISQGRLEALLNFQTVIMELTAMEIANASLLDEATAAAEAMIMMFNSRSREKIKSGSNKFFVDSNIFPQTLAVTSARARSLGIELVTGNYHEIKLDEKYFGILLQYPAGDGEIHNYRDIISDADRQGIYKGVVADIMSLALLAPPGKWGADVVVGSTQRFGIPLGYGGPHAGYFATLEKFKRHIPGRIIGVTLDVQGKNALRMALQTREQHIKREKATSNICTAQALLATMAGMYAVYHGSEGLKRIANHIHMSAVTLARQLERLGYKQRNRNFFDTLRITLPDGISKESIEKIALQNKINFLYADDKTIGISLDETTLIQDINNIALVLPGPPIRNW